MYINFCERDDGVKEYLKRYRGHALLVGLFVFLLHGAKLNSDIIGIDTEDLIFWGKDFYGGWLNTGRHGLVFLKHLFGNAEFNPYFTGIMTLLLFTAAVSALLALWDWTGGRKSLWGWCFAGLLLISHPAMVEQFYFSLQSMEICMAMGLTALALCLSRRWAEERRLAFGAGSVGILLLTFSSYQSFVVLYIFGAASLVLLQALGEISGGKKVTERTLIRRVLSYCILFAIAFLLNTLITKLFFGSSDYLSNQIVWGKLSIKDCLRDIAAHVFKAFTGYGSCFYSAGLGILAVWDLVWLAVFLRKNCRERKGVSALILLCYLALLGVPFMMTLVLGHTPAMRSQLALPGLTGFLGYLSVVLTGGGEEKAGEGRDGKGKSRYYRAAFGIAAAVCLITGMEQAKVTESLYYTDSLRSEQDIALGRALVERIEQVNPEGYNLPVIVIGGREFQGNRSCVTGEIIGRSFFNYDRDVEPIAYWSTKRALGFLHILGADYDRIPMERVGEGVEYSLDMPRWPAEGSVRVINGMIVIKLSGNLE